MSQDESTYVNQTNPQNKAHDNHMLKSIPQVHKLKDHLIASKTKKSRKSIAAKLHTQSKQSRHQNELSIEKQIKLTQFWKGTSTLSQSLPKHSLPNGEIIKKKMEEEIQEKNRMITKIKAQRDGIQRKFILLENEKRMYQNKAKDQIKKSLLELSKIKRGEQGSNNPTYGYFHYDKEKGGVVFLEGPFLKQLRIQISKRTKQMQQMKQWQSNDTNKNKQTLQFQQRFIQKQIDELTKELQEREEKVLAYKDKLKFSQIQESCYYSKIGWPAIGEDERFQTLQLLGSGGFGSVYKCYDFVQNNFVALKQNRFQTGTSSKNQQLKQKYLKHMNREVKIQKSLHHPNIAKLIQVIKIDENEVSFVLEYCEGPQLAKYLKKNKCLEQKQAKQIIRQVICALKYLDQQDSKVIHYDLKPANIMFHRGVVKLVDFGLCKQMQSDETRIDLTSFGTGTYYYLPPQTFMEEDAEVSTKVDIWSVGVIFFELLYGKKPFGHGLSQQKIYNEGIILKALKVDFPQQTPLKYKVSEGAKTFIMECLKYQQNERLSPVEAYNHQYFK